MTKAVFSSPVNLSQVVFPILKQSSYCFIHPHLVFCRDYCLGFLCSVEVKTISVVGEWLQMMCKGTHVLFGGKQLISCFFFSSARNGQKGGGEGRRGQVSAPLHTGSQTAPREETLHWRLLLDPRCKRCSDRHRSTAVLSKTQFFIFKNWTFQSLL